MALNVDAGVAHFPELLPSDGLSSGFRTSFHVVGINEHRKGIAEFFKIGQATEYPEI